MTNQGLTLNPEQAAAVAQLHLQKSYFLSGAAGSGKSFVIRNFLNDRNLKKTPVLASTGAAAILVGGRTFHSFFGIGLMEGGVGPTFERVKKDRRVAKRLVEADTLVIDEVSMLPGQALEVADALCRWFRDPAIPWGGLQMIFVGDFAQLPPVSQTSRRDWAFRSSAWQNLQMEMIYLQENERVSDSSYHFLLNQIRQGRIDQSTEALLNGRLVGTRNIDSHTQLFSRRADVESFNQKRLEELPGETQLFHTMYLGEAKYLASAKKQSPVSETLAFKKNCKVMIVQNDPKNRWVNGSLGVLKDFGDEYLKIELLNGRVVEVPQSTFTILDGDGEPVCAIVQYPVVLAYATTIHKAQGATMDELCVDLSSLWEPGQAYVALSRLRKLDGLHLRRWSRRSVIVDPEVVAFYTKSQRVPEQTGIVSSDLM